MRKPVSETQALVRLGEIKADLKSEISNFESRAESCQTCETPGACCIDAHFVNVHISRLEAVAIVKVLNKLPSDIQSRITHRVDETIAEYALTPEGDTFSQKFACPLFEKGVGCLVHSTAKPAACITHACYEREGDLPPDDLQTAAERQIDELNTRVYARPQQWLPIPLAIKRRAAS
jgi:hypothetical protein